MPSKIATAEDVQTELKTLLAMTEEPEPSRAKMAAAISDLASRVAGGIQQDIKYYLTPRYLQVYSIFESYGRVHHVTGDLTDIEKRLLKLRDALLSLFQSNKDNGIVYPNWNDVIVDGVSGGRNKMIVYFMVGMPGGEFTEGHIALFDQVLGRFPEGKPAGY